MNRIRQFVFLFAAVGWLGMAPAQTVPKDYDPGKNRAAERAAAKQAAAVKQQAEAERLRRMVAEAEAVELKRQLEEQKRQAAEALKQATESQKKVGADNTAASPASLSVLRDTLKDGGLGPEMIVIPAGSFEMGSNDGKANERPVHAVRIGKAFALGRTEVTVDEFRAFVKATGYKTDAELGTGGTKGCYAHSEDDLRFDWRAGLNWDAPGFEQRGVQPVVCVSWNDARDYAKWLSEQTGKAYRLPSEAEWEYAARAGTKTSRYWGDKPDEACAYANVADRTRSPQGRSWSGSFANCFDGHFFTAPVGSFNANRHNLHDMLGNVFESVDDCWSDNYAGHLQANERSRTSGDCGRRVIRGGSWNTSPASTRAAVRERVDTTDRNTNHGFRLARTLP